MLYQRAALKHFLCAIDVGQIKPTLKKVYNSLRLEQQGDVIHRHNIMHADDLLGRDMTEHGDLLLGGLCQRLRDNQSACNLTQHTRQLEQLFVRQVKTDQVREKAEAAQSVDSCLRGFCFLLPMHVRHKRDVDERKVLVANAKLELPHRLHKGRGLDIANSSAELSKC